MHGLSTVFPQFLSIFCAAFAAGAFFFARRAGKHAERLYDLARENTIDALSTSKLADLERALVELSDSHEALHASHKRLRSKYGMRDMRERKLELERADNGGQVDFADDEAEKARFKAALRRQCKERGLLK